MSDLRIGDHYIIHGRFYVVCGFEPMSLPDRCVELEDTASGDHFKVAFDEIASWHRSFRLRTE
jgi:hypothetical protein